jgi:anti-anti-sigma regulatory factor
MRYRLADHGLVFSTRDRGARMLADFRETIVSAKTEPVEIDFSEVRSVSHSFVDEFIGELMTDTAGLEAMPSLVNVSPSAARTIERSLRRRGFDPEPILSDALEAA